MPRELIDFAHVEDLPWQECRLAAGNLPVRTRLLSKDSDTGGSTMYVELPPAWRSKEPGYDDGDEEIFVLSGDLAINDVLLAKYSYLFLPAGRLRQRSTTRHGAILLSYHARSSKHIPANAHGPMYEPSRAASPLNLEDMAYEKPKSEGFPAGAARKTLRLDEQRDESTWVLGILPLWTSPLVESHTYTEEIFILEGTIDTTVGRMTQGSYLVHPPEALHGPMGSRTGCLFINHAFGPWGNTFVPVGGYRLPPE